ncbi:MAG TPA: DUF4142 domain-containing protein [Pseudoxanthomonas sp.]|nr:DUF4142 domain-containing protein [Pseudoxanthomonas sp.]
MKKYFVVTALATCMALAGCGDRNNDQTATPDPVATPSDAAVNTGGPVTDGGNPTAVGAAGGQPANGAMGGVNLTEQERAALGVLNAVNELEIAASNQALKNNVSAPVAEYARMMVDEHTANHAETSAMNPQMDAQMANEQKTKGDAVLQNLSGQTGAGYEKAYIEAMIKSHTDALATLDTKLIPAATTPAVVTHLQATRASVAAHLERAQALQTSTR